jgi:hypothetical protein
MIDRYSGEILECTVNKIIILSNSAHTWVSMKARKYRITI